jgi:hypothetical protein
MGSVLQHTIVSVFSGVIFYVVTYLNNGKYLLKIKQSDIDIKKDISFENLFERIKGCNKYKVLYKKEQEIIVRFRKNIFDFGIHILIKVNNGTVKIYIRSCLLPFMKIKKHPEVESIIKYISSFN